jgi:hypothetical protein
MSWQEEDGNYTYVLYFIGDDSGTDHCLVVARRKKRPSLTKRATEKFYMQICSKEAK